MFSFYNRIENIVGKGENAGYLHFFPKMFSEDLFSLGGGVC